MASKLRSMPATRRRSSSASRTRPRSAPARRRKAPRRRKRSRFVPAIRGSVARLRSRTPLLGERGREVLALALLACGLYLVFVIYGGWDGGRVGHGLTVALGWILGRARIFAPLALLVAGCALLLGPAIGLQRPLRGGAICLFAAITLALAAGTLGISSGPGAHGAAWTSAHMQSHGGVLGEALFRLASPLVRGVGVAILVVFLAITGTMLLTGSSLGTLLRDLGRLAATVGGLLRRRLLDGERAGEGGKAPVLAAHDDFPAPAALTHAGVGSAVADIWGEEPVVEPEPAAEAAAQEEEQLQLAEPEQADDEEDEEDASGATFTPASEDGRGADPAGPLPRLGHRRPRVRVGAARRRGAADPLGSRGRTSRHHRTGAHGASPGGGARALRRTGEGDRDRRRTPHHPL